MPPPPQRPVPSPAGRANLFSCPLPPLPNRHNPKSRAVPLLPLPPGRRHPENHHQQPFQEQAATLAPRTTHANPAFRAPHLRTSYRKPVPPAAATGKGEALLTTDPTDAAAGRSVVVGPSGVTFRLPGAPFDFQFSYSEAPRAAPLAIREPPFLPFAPPTMPRPWTGKAPLLTKEEKARRRGVRLHTPLGQEPPQTVSPYGVMMEVRGRRQLDFARVSPGDGRSREEVLGEPLTSAEARELVKPHMSHNRQLNIGRDGLTHNMLEMIHCHWRRQEVCKVRCRGVPTVDMNNLCYHLEAHHLRGYELQGSLTERFGAATWETTSQSAWRTTSLSSARPLGRSRANLDGGRHPTHPLSPSPSLSLSLLPSPSFSLSLSLMIPSLPRHPCRRAGRAGLFFGHEHDHMWGIVLAAGRYGGVRGNHEARSVRVTQPQQKPQEKSGGKVIKRVGGVVFLYRGRNYNPHTRPHYPLMLWKPATPVYPKLIQQAPEGLTVGEAAEMRRRGQILLPILKLAKNGIYINLVKDVQDAFEGNDLVKIDCKSLEPSDYKKIGAKLRDLVPCVLLSFDKEQILIYRGKGWKSRYLKPLTPVPKVEKNNLTVSSVVGSSGESAGASNNVTIREVLRPRMFKLWKRAIESSIALSLDDDEANALTPDTLLVRVEEFSITSQAVEHSFPALLVGNGKEGPEALNESEDESDVGIIRPQENQFEKSLDAGNDDHFEYDMLERLESSAPLGSLPIDSVMEQLNSE